MQPGSAESALDLLALRALLEKSTEGEDEGRSELESLVEAVFNPDFQYLSELVIW